MNRLGKSREVGGCDCYTESRALLSQWPRLRPQIPYGTKPVSRRERASVQTWPFDFSIPGLSPVTFAECLRLARIVRLHGLWAAWQSADGPALSRRAAQCSGGQRALGGFLEAALGAGAVGARSGRGPPSGGRKEASAEPGLACTVDLAGRQRGLCLPAEAAQGPGREG